MDDRKSRRAQGSRAPSHEAHSGWGSSGQQAASGGDQREAVVQLARARMRAGWYDADPVLAKTIERMLPALDD